VRLIKMFGLAAIAAVAAMAFVGATSASATSTVLCLEHNVSTGLLCPAGKERTHVHAILAKGEVGRLLSPISVLCLGVLIESIPLGLAVNGPQVIHTAGTVEKEPGLAFTGCGTGSAHDNCKVTVEELPLSHLLKTGLDQGILLNLSGRTRLVCSNIGINCVYDLEGSEFTAAANHLTAEETPTVELGGKFFCPDEGFLDGLLENLLPTYILK